MNAPKMVLFDAGRTLLEYQDIDTLKGVTALMPYITSNPRELTAEEIDRCTNQVFSHFDKSRKQLYEVPEQTILKLVYDLLELKFSISLAEVERIIWSSDSKKIPTKYAGEVLDALYRKHIDTAVISNLDFSGDLLRVTLNELFPDNHFKFVIASSDYGIRKPHPYIFQAGIAMSGYQPKDIWYVGDKVPVDVEGSRNAGMIPVLYQNARNHYDVIPENLMVISDLRELINLVNTIEE